MPSTRALPTIRPAFAALLAVPLLLLGCSAPAAGPQPAPGQQSPVEGTQGAPSTGESPNVNPAPGAGAARVATLKVGADQYTFEPTFCAITGEDVLIHGPGTIVGAGTPAYLDIDFVFYDGSWDGGVHVNIGVDRQFVSPDEKLIFTSGRGNSMITSAPDASMFSVLGDFYVNGNEPAIESKLEVDCG